MRSKTIDLAIEANVALVAEAGRANEILALAVEQFAILLAMAAGGNPVTVEQRATAIAAIRAAQEAFGDVEREIGAIGLKFDAALGVMSGEVKQ